MPGINALEYVAVLILQRFWCKAPWHCCTHTPTHTPNTHFPYLVVKLVIEEVFPQSLRKVEDSCDDDTKKRKRKKEGGGGGRWGGESHCVTSKVKKNTWLRTLYMLFKSESSLRGKEWKDSDRMHKQTFAVKWFILMKVIQWRNTEGKTGT